MEDKTECNVGEPENSDMDDKTDCNVGEPQNSDADKDNFLYGARSCDQNPESPNLTVKPSATETKDEDGYIPGPFTFIPECEMRPESSSWQEYFDTCGKNPGHLPFYTIPEFLKDTKSILRTKNVCCDGCTVQTAKDLVLHMSKVTTKVTSIRTSKERPEYFPGTESKYPFYGKTGLLRYATGILSSCLVPQVGECVCGKCKHQKYWLCLVQTATHGVCNAEEAALSTFDFYDIDKVMADQGEAVKNKSHDGDGNEVKDRKKVMEEWEEVLKRGKMTINGTGITVRDFEKRHKYFKYFFSGQSAIGIDRRFVDNIHYLKKQSDFPFVGDMNVVVCVTHEEAIATKLETAWNGWIKYQLKHEYSIFDYMSKFFRPMVACPHGGPLMLSVGSEPNVQRVTLKEVIASSNDFLESHHIKQSKFWSRYNVESDTGNCLIPEGCEIFPPRGLCKKDLVPGTDRVTLPARTKVETFLDDSEGYGWTEYSLRKTTDIPTDCVKPLFNYLYFTYDTPTCPGSSGAFVWNLDFLLRRYKPITHSGASGEYFNKSGIWIKFW